jgi:hypothetical protein
MLVHVVAKSGEAAKSGPIGLAVILVLCIVCYFLFKSMSKHMRKVREEFPGQQSSAHTPGPSPSSAPAPSADPPSPAGPPTEASSGRPAGEGPAE